MKINRNSFYLNQLVKFCNLYSNLKELGATSIEGVTHLGFQSWVLQHQCYEKSDWKEMEGQKNFFFGLSFKKRFHQ